MKNTGHIWVWTRGWSEENGINDEVRRVAAEQGWSEEVEDDDSDFHASITGEKPECFEGPLDGLLKLFRDKRPGAFTIYAGSGEGTAELHALLDEARQGQ